MYGEVESVERISQGMIRIILGGGELNGFVPAPFADQYINAYFIPKGAPYEAPFDLEQLKEVQSGFQPRARRFTIRKWDEKSKLMTIDFFTHGDQGHAGVWAQNAKPGDRLQFKGPNGSYSPDSTADWHLLAGDESAIPAISASIEAMHSSKICIAFMVVDSPEQEISLQSDAKLKLTWLHRSKATEPEAVLLEAIKGFTFPSGKYDAFIHGEAAEVREIRKHLIRDRGVDKSASSISPYWRRDHTDEEWRSVKKQWLEDQRKEDEASLPK